jgi:hypothetical protein
MNITYHSNIDRVGRGFIGATALGTVLMAPDLNTGWLFALAMIGAYTSLTALLNADLFHVGSDRIADPAEAVHESGSGKQRAGTAYKKAA